MKETLKSLVADLSILPVILLPACAAIPERSLVFAEHVLPANTIPYPSQATYIPLDMEEVECLALNIYHEARGEGREGEEAVADVTLNRVNSGGYPNTVCEVVKQGVYYSWSDDPVRNKCQFSWWCDGKSDTPTDEVAWWLSLSTAMDKLEEEILGIRVDRTHGSEYYHASYVTPWWAQEFTITTTIGGHIFYARQ